MREIGATRQVLCITHLPQVASSAAAHFVVSKAVTGGRTVSAFLAAGLLDRLQLAVAPLIIGEGRPAIRLPPPARLGDCRRPSHRVYRMGEDILFDCDLGTPAHPVAAGPGDTADDEPPVVRVL